MKDPTLAGNFTAFVQGGGFVIASLVPLTSGYLRFQDDLAGLRSGKVGMATAT